MGTRSIKELLQLMLNNVEHCDNGLCALRRKLFMLNLLNDRESILLNNYIIKNRPSKFSSINAFMYRNDNYYWEKTDITPRIKWLKKHIAKL